jgi:coenzyme F420-reducing hydrogenase delta subunit
MYCCENSAALAAESVKDSELMSEYDIVSLPCSGRIESTLILKTLERGYAGVVVLGCPEDNCKYVTGNKRASNRVEQVRSILANAGLDGESVMMDYVSSVDAHKVEDVMRRMADRLQPAAQSE